MTTLVKVENLAATYDGVVALQGISFEFGRGEHTSVLGPSGSGKSTLLRLLAGLEAPSQGRIWIKDQLVSEAGRCWAPPHRRGLSMVFQDLALWPNLNALDNVILGLAAVEPQRKARRIRALEALRHCGLGGLEQRKPGTLSIGQQQRVALARALAVRPELLLLDEPFSNLDVLLRTQLLDELRRLAEECATTLVLVTHDPLEASVICQKALVLECGALVDDGPVAKLLTSSKSQMLQAVVRQWPLRSKEPGR